MVLKSFVLIWSSYKWMSTTLVYQTKKESRLKLDFRKSFPIVGSLYYSTIYCLICGSVYGVNFSISWINFKIASYFVLTGITSKFIVLKKERTITIPCSFKRLIQLQFFKAVTLFKGFALFLKFLKWITRFWRDSNPYLLLWIQILCVFLPAKKKPRVWSKKFLVNVQPIEIFEEFIFTEKGI